MTKIGSVVKQLRKNKGMTQAELARRAQLSTGYLPRLESGKFKSPGLAQIKRIAMILKINTWELVRYTEEGLECFECGCMSVYYDSENYECSLCEDGFYEACGYCSGHPLLYETDCCFYCKQD